MPHRHSGAELTVPGRKDELKHSFLTRAAQSEFIRLSLLRSNKTLLFLFAALTIQCGVAKSIIRSSADRIAGFDGAACAAEKR